MLNSGESVFPHLTLRRTRSSPVHGLESRVTYCNGAEPHTAISSDKDVRAPRFCHPHHNPPSHHLIHPAIRPMTIA
jgi:hypothetical protein